MPIDRLRDTEQLLQQPVHAGRPEQVAAPHHLGDALQGVVDHDGQMIAGRRLLARQDDVAPGFRPRGHDRRVSPPGPSPCSVQVRSCGTRTRRRHVEPQRVRRALRDQPAALVRRKRFRGARIERRPVGIARPRRVGLRVARPAGQFPRGSRRPDRSGPGLPVFPPPRDSAQNAPIAAAPAFPRICRARRGLRRSPPRIPAGNAWRRYPRSAAGTGRHSCAPGRSSATPNRRGRDGGSRSGSAQIGKRVAALISFAGHDGFKGQ